MNRHEVLAGWRPRFRAPEITRGNHPMRISLVLLLSLLGLAGCVDVHEHPNPQPQSATVITPAPTAPVYTVPGSTSTTVVSHP
jgi:hypothetical protein